MPHGSERLLARMWNSPHGHRFRDVHSVLCGHGFRVTDIGKHRVYRHDKFADLKLSVPRHRSVKSWVIRRVLELIQTLSQREEAEAAN